MPKITGMLLELIAWIFKTFSLPSYVKFKNVFVNSTALVFIRVS